MGYWPKVLVPSFAQGADLITFGGEVLNLAPPGRHTSTQMGTGHFSREGFRKASFFKKVQVIKAQTPNTYVSPEKTRVNIERPKCYDLEVGKNLKGNWGYFFFYGGPGGSCT
ncbi:hypothetical protein Taro_021077 [Colocasia esculenta]|uniref:Neprosin PEP catalytic domain-containing protein n=1 Tax=Colocasia esculenta TaxID=4460 RepID=A0A843UY07_COLES|nr:hypothetical protein [Colocasia esculenta]